jgi:hypothetical protein
VRPLDSETGKSRLPLRKARGGQTKTAADPEVAGENTGITYYTELYFIKK